MLIDRYGRPLTNLRVMVTGKCNYNCFFCHMEGYNEESREKELSFEEIRILAEAGKKIGIKSYKITGGEPTLRSDLSKIVRIFHENRAYVSITTNASLLHLHLNDLVEAGLGHMNISLHSLRENRFRLITGYRGLQKIIANVIEASKYFPLKINVVVLRGLNDDEVDDFVEFAGRLGARLQFIELHPVGKARSEVFEKHHLPWFTVLEKLKKRVNKIIYRYGLHNRPILFLDNGITVELVGPVGNPAFCAACTRIRVSYDFKLIPCLNWRGPPLNVRNRLKDKKSLEEKIEEVVKALKEIIMLREPFYLCRFDKKTSPIIPRRKWKTARLGIPKKGGRLEFTGRNKESHLKHYLLEWI